jgi:hypothetical protein
MQHRSTRAIASMLLAGSFAFVIWNAAISGQPLAPCQGQDLLDAPRSFS